MTVARTRLTVLFVLFGLLVSGCNSQPAAPPTISDPMISDPTPQEPGKEVGISVDVSSAGGVTLTYTWNADGGEIVRGQGSPAITYRVPEEPGTYNVRVKVEWDGQSVEKVTTIQVEDLPQASQPTVTSQPVEPSTSTPTSESFKLGILGPFSGPGSRTGEEFKDAVNMAFSESGWHIEGYKIDPVWIDSQSDRTTAIQAYEQAITQDGVQAGLLNWHSSVAVGCMDVVAEHEIPHFAGFGATDVVNETFHSNRDKYGYWTTKWWPTASKLSVSYVQMLEDAIDSGHWSPSEKTVAIYGEDTDWGRTFCDGLKANFEDAGWTVVTEEYFPVDQTDFTDLMNTLNGLSPAVVAGTNYSLDSAAAFINHADATGLNSVIIADGLGWTGNWYDQTGSSSDYVVYQIPGWASDESQAFRQAFKNRYDYTPSPSPGGLAYDAANFFISVAQATYEQYGELSSETLYSFTQDQIWTGQWTYTDGVMMEEYKYTEQTIPDPVIGKGHYMFPVLQYFDGEGEVIFPSDRADRSFTTPSN